MHLDVDISTPITPPPSSDINTHFETDTERAKMHLSAGVRAAQSGDRNTARKMLLRASELDPDDSRIWLWLASISEYPEELLVFVENVLAIDPANEKALQWRSATASLLARTFVQRGIDAAESGQAMYAEDCFSKALEYDDGNIDAMLWLVSLSRDNEDRVSLLTRILEIDPENAAATNALRNLRIEEETAKFDLIRTLAAEGSVERAVAQLGDFTAEYPKNVAAWMLLSHLLSNPSEKISAIERVLQLEPENEAARSSHDSLRAIFGEFKPASDPVICAPGSNEDQASPVVEAASLPDDEIKGIEYETPIAPPTEDLAFFDNGNTEAVPETVAVDPPYVGDPLVAELGSLESETDWDRETELYGAEEFSGEAEPERMVDGAEADTANVELSAIPMPAEPAAEMVDTKNERTGFETFVESREPGTEASGSACPFCSASVKESSFVCGSCYAVLTFSDLEGLLNNGNADRDIIRKAVDAMESERLKRPLDEGELTVLGIGHLNLRNLQFGYDCIRDAARMNPDDILLASNLNSLLIRIEEIKQQEACHASITSGKKILVVDDSPTIRKLIAGKLEKCGHEVFLCEDGMAAMEWLDDLVPDLILLDITMPKMDGYEVCRQIRGSSATAHVPVLMISGKDGFFDKVRGRMAGTTGYITKPFGPETLMKAIEFYLGGGGDLETDQPGSEMVH